VGNEGLDRNGQKGGGIRYAESNSGINDPLGAIAKACEEVLLSSGMNDEAYARYANLADRGTSHLSTFRAIAEKYPQKTAVEILHNLVESTPGEEGKWFGSAKSVGLYDEAIALANKAPCDPRTLTRAAKEAASEHPAFAVEAGIAALRWLCEGYGYEITPLDIWAAYRHTMKAAVNAGSTRETGDRIRELAQTSSVRFIVDILSKELE